MSYVNYMSIFMNHLKSNIFFFTIYKSEVEYQIHSILFLIQKMFG